MRRSFRFFLLSLLLTALAAGGSVAYRSSTVADTADGPALMRAKTRPLHPAQLTHALTIASPAQQAPRSFVPPGELALGEATAPMAFADSQQPVAGAYSTADKRYLDHNYPFHAFW